MAVPPTSALLLAAALSLTPAAASAQSTSPKQPLSFAQPAAVGPPSSSVPQYQGSAQPRRDARWTTPAAPLRLLARFDLPAQPWLPGHRGIDLQTHVGQVVSAAGSGRVAFVGTVAGRPVLSIDHGQLRTTYEPVVSRLRVGQLVAAGDQVGTVGVGTGHCGDGGCVHFGLRRGAQYLDPLLLIGHTRARLRPW
jgi:murein DD-endopeptidase MepM/ murein hydrolase activator NlpD